LKNGQWLWLFQHIIVWADTTEKVMVMIYFKGKPIEHIYACFPTVFMPFHFFDSKGWMVNIVHKKPYLFIEFFLRILGKPIVILLKGFGAEDSHFLRSAIKSSMESNDLIFPATISLSASASAFSQLKSLK